MENKNNTAVETTANNETTNTLLDDYRKKIMVASKKDRVGRLFTNHSFIVLAKALNQITDNVGKTSFYTELLLGYGDGTDTLNVTGSEYLYDIVGLYEKYDIGFDIHVDAKFNSRVKLKVSSLVKAVS